MILLTHIIIAVSSVVFTTFLLLQPSTVKLRISYALVVATIASGTHLTILNPAQMLHTCMAGLIYAILVTTGIMIARHKMIRTARQQTEL